MNEQPKRTTWKKNPNAVKADILKVAIREFGEHGLAGARVDEIAKKTATSKRMIYYYFGDKEQLYQQALEQEYARLRNAESELDLSHFHPVEALRKLTEFTFDWHRENPDFIRLVVIENAVKGKHLELSKTAKTVNSSITANVSELLVKGMKSGDFKTGLDPIIVHMMMSATSFYNMSNRYTFSLNFGEHIRSEKSQMEIRESLVGMIFGLVLSKKGRLYATTQKNL